MVDVTRAETSSAPTLDHRLAILLPSAGAWPADRERCRALVEFLHRRARLDSAMPDTAEPETPPDRSRITASLLHLRDRGLLSYAPADTSVEVFYTASPAASQSVFTTGSGFPEAVQKKQTAAFRSSPGALFRFPAADGDGSLAVFITDWSPCPAACAVAIHRAHPWAAGFDRPAAAGFTGRYVRHPLTGDLLPVWVADWVRPDFGTGAVLVNPAHDPTDLAFGRAVGLPIRFALVPDAYDGSPETWPDPPLVRSGRSVRTGPYDGLPAEAAADRYFEVLAARGLAERHRDLQAGRWRIGRLLPDAGGDLVWSPARHGLQPASGPPPPGSFTVRRGETELLTAALAATAAASPLLVGPAGEQAGELLALRLLAYDLADRDLVPAAVFLVQKVQETKVEAPAEVLRLAAWLGAPISQVAVVKQQTVEQVQRFLRVHRELLAQAAEPGGKSDCEPDEASRRAFAKVKEAVREADPAKAFSLLLQAQKPLHDAPPEKRAAALPGYFALAGVLAGVEAPAGFDAARAWQRL